MELWLNYEGNSLEDFFKKTLRPFGVYLERFLGSCGKFKRGRAKWDSVLENNEFGEASQAEALWRSLASGLTLHKSSH